MDLSKLHKWLEPNGRVHVAFSGGADSLCLAHFLSKQPLASTSDRIICWHLDHGLDPESGHRALAAKERALELGLPIKSVKLNMKTGGNLEARAREKRYAFFREVVGSGDVLVTAHHADDLAETLLLRMLRGSGVSGLSGISPDQAFGQGRLVRPLLNWRREKILSYLEDHSLSWVSDPTNEHRSIDRNFLRHEIMPLLEKRFPQAVSAMQRSALLNMEASQEIAHLAQIEIQKRQRPDHRLHLEHLDSLSLFMQREVIRQWCLSHGVVPPPATSLDSFTHQIQSHPSDRCPTLTWPEATIRSYQSHLWLEDAKSKSSTNPQAYELLWDGQAPLELPSGLGTLHFSAASASDLQVALAGSEMFVVKSAQPSERILLRSDHPPVRTKKVFAEAQIPPWVRDYWPRLWHEDTLLALGDRWQDPRLCHCLVWESSSQIKPHPLVD